MKTKLWLLGATLSLLFVSPAQAANTEGWYVSVEGGGVWVDEWEHLRTKIIRCVPVTTLAEASFSTGWGALASVGYGLQHWRVEFEGGYRSNELDSYSKGGKTYDDVSGELTQATAMLNVIYDVPLGEKISLGIGVGAGGDFTELSLNFPWHAIDHDAWQFAYQGLAGLNYALTNSLAMYVNYRYLNVKSDAFDATPGLHIDGDDFQKHTATFGLRYAFAPPLRAVPMAPPAPPQPAAPAEREFLIFFGFNKANLTAQALDTVRQAATVAQQYGTAKIRVVGHTDRAGSLSYNKALSMRRAGTVKDALIVEGVMGSAISIAGRGEDEPIVPTADGAREPQNRRVKITF